MWTSNKLIQAVRPKQRSLHRFFSIWIGQRNQVLKEYHLRLGSLLPISTQPCYACCQRSTYQPVGLLVRELSSRHFNDKPADNPFVDPDVGDFIEDPSHPVSKDQASDRIKVKFNWKNSLVTTDSLKLLETLYTTHPQLVEFRENDVIDYLQRMSVYSIDVEKAAKMVIMNPNLIKMNDTAVSAVIGALRAIGLSESQRGHVARVIPEIFDLPPKRITKTFSFLKTWLSKEETLDVICKSVHVLLDSEETLKSKLEYLIKDMSHSTKDIVASKALIYPLKHIKTRHEFLIRSGLFKPIPYRKIIKVMEKDFKDKGKTRPHYFKPREVVCFKDEDFLEICTKNLLTLNELAAFEELYGAELEMLDDQEGQEELEMIGLEKEEDDGYDDTGGEAVSLVKNPNSVGFFSETESKGCYF